jgi:uncharacterized LabA/DUF88 family protein
MVSASRFFHYATKQMDMRRFNQLVRFYAGTAPYRSVWFGTRNPSGSDGSFLHVLSSIGIEARHYRLARKETVCPSCFGVSTCEVQKGVDVGLAVFAIKEALRDRYNKLLLIAGDGDFLDLVHEIQQSGRTVCVVGTPETISESLKEISDRIIDITDTLPLCRRGGLTSAENRSWKQIQKLSL